MSIKVNIANQVHQTNLPAWRPLLPLFEAAMNSFQAIKEAQALEPALKGRVLIDLHRQADLLRSDTPPTVGFRVTDNGIGLDDSNFDSFNTAFSSHKFRAGGKGLGRFTWLKAFERADIESTFRTERGFETRTFKFDEHYDLDERGLPRLGAATAAGTQIDLVGLRNQYTEQCPRSPDVFIQKLIEHFIPVLLESDCPHVGVYDLGKRYDINDIFARAYRASCVYRKPYSS
jgi:hypothetical protein